MLSVVFLRVTSLTYSPLREYLPNTQVWITMSLIQVKVVLQEKKWPVNSTQLHKWLSSRQTSCVGKQHRWCVHTAHLANQTIFKNLLLKGFNKINDFYCLVKNIVKWNSSGLFWNFVCRCTTRWLGQWLVALLHLRWSTSTFPTTALTSAALNVGTVKRQISSHYYQKKLWPLALAERVSGTADTP